MNSPKETVETLLEMMSMLYQLSVKATPTQTQYLVVSCRFVRKRLIEIANQRESGYGHRELSSSVRKLHSDLFLEGFENTVLAAISMTAEVLSENPGNKAGPFMGSLYFCGITGAPLHKTELPSQLQHESLL